MALESRPFNLQLGLLLDLINDQIPGLTKDANSQGVLRSYTDGDGYAPAINSPLPMVSWQRQYNVDHDIISIRDLGQGETRYISALDSDGYEILIPNHTTLKIVTIKFRIQSDTYTTSSNAFASAGALQHRIRTWQSFRDALRLIGVGLLKVFPVATASVPYNSRLVHIAAFDAEFAIPVNDLEITSGGIINSISADGYYETISGVTIEDSFILPDDVVIDLE